MPWRWWEGEKGRPLYHNRYFMEHFLSFSSSRYLNITTFLVDYYDLFVGYSVAGWLLRLCWLVGYYTIPNTSYLMEKRTYIHGKRRTENHEELMKFEFIGIPFGFRFGSLNALWEVYWLFFWFEVKDDSLGWSSLFLQKSFYWNFNLLIVCFDRRI